MKRVLLTGASGFIGRHCVPHLLRRGFEVHAVVSERTDVVRDVAVHRVNLLDAQAAGRLVRAVRADALLHLAWYAKPGAYWTADENFDWLAASIHLLREFIAAGGTRFVGAGTCAEYDWNQGVCNEVGTPCCPSTVYGASKHALHVISEALGRREGISAAWGRLFFVYGPHEQGERFVPAVIHSLLDGKPAQCTSGEQVRDFLHVDDQASALAALLDSDVEGAVNIASGHGVALRDVALEIARQLRSEKLLALGALPSRLNEPPLVVGTTHRLNAEVGWTPTRTLEDGLRETIAWWQSQMHTAGRTP